MPSTQTLPFRLNASSLNPYAIKMPRKLLITTQYTHALVAPFFAKRPKAGPNSVSAALILFAL